MNLTYLLQSKHLISPDRGNHLIGQPRGCVVHSVEQNADGLVLCNVTVFLREGDQAFVRQPPSEPMQFETQAQSNELLSWEQMVQAGNVIHDYGQMVSEDGDVVDFPPTPPALGGLIGSNQPSETRISLSDTGPEAAIEKALDEFTGQSLVGSPELDEFAEQVGARIEYEALKQQAEQTAAMVKEEYERHKAKRKK